MEMPNSINVGLPFTEQKEDVGERGDPTGLV
jgi:hypothetical protein